MISFPKHTLSPSEVARIDVVRGFLCVYIYLFHWCETYKEQFSEPWFWIKDVFFKGYIAVQIFFILSGFLIALSAAHLPPRMQAQRWSQFYVKRFFRIFPTWTVVLLIFCLNIWQLSVSNYFYNLFFLYGFSPFKLEILTAYHSWSLFVELQFYALFPLIYFLITRNLIFHGIAVFLFGAALVDANIHVPQGLLFFTPFNTFHYFLFGVGVYFFWDKLRNIQTSQFISVGLFLIVLLASILIRDKTQLIFVYGAFWFVFIAQPIPLITNLLMFLFQRVGRWCYSFYLIHAMCVWKAKNVAEFLFKDQGRLAFDTLWISLPMSLFCAWLLYRFVEKPGIQWGKKIWLMVCNPPLKEERP